MREARQEVDRVLAELGALVGAPLQLDAQGVVALEFADDITCTVAVPDLAEYVFIEVTVARLPARHREELLSAALRRNRLGFQLAGASIALDEAGEELLLCHSLPAEPAAIDRLADTLAELIAEAGELRGLLHGAHPAGDAVGRDDFSSSTLLFRG